MLRIGICDDNREDIARIRELAVRFSEEHPETPVQIQAYGQPYDLLDEVEKSGGFDLYLLDVVMPHMTGVALARRLRERKERAEILFLTVSKEYAVDAFSVKAAGYLIKPVSKPDFDGAVLECIHRLLPENNPSLMLKSKDGLYRVPVGELVCVESFNHNQVCTLADGSVLAVSATMAELMEALKEQLDLIDRVLLMTVEPGFGGQKLMPEVLDKVSELRAMGFRGEIEADGGIKPENMRLLTDAGVEVLVMGTAFFGAENPAGVARLVHAI